MIDHRMMKLGRAGIYHDPRSLQMARYTEALAPPPLAVDWTKGITAFGMMLNGPDPANPPALAEGVGCCTISGCGHAVQIWTANTGFGSMITVPDTTIEQFYEEWDGYNPADPSTDQGGIELNVLKAWRQGGFAGHQLTAFADPHPADLLTVRQSISLFGGVYIGLSLPVTAQNQAVWDAVSNGNLPCADAEPGSWGGHCVFVPKYDENGFTCITWGGLQEMTLAFWEEYCDEVHTLLSRDWLGAKGSPAGFNQAQLEADLAAVTA